jgi:hypothetical protein
MKIVLEFNNYQLAFLNEFIADYLPDNLNGLDKESKAGIYIMREFAGKLLKKAIDKREDLNRFKIDLKYYEACALHAFLFKFIDYLSGIDNSTVEKRRIIREILGEINQKLA